MIAVPIQRLIAVLEKQCSIHQELLEWADRKREALIHNRVDEVSSIVNKESKLMRTVSECLREQQEATAAFFRTKGFQPTREVTVTELSRIVTEPKEKEALLQARDRLNGIIAELRKKNEVNQQLIEQSLAFINYSIDVMLGPDEEPTYRNPAAPDYGTPKRSGYFDSKA